MRQTQGLLQLRVRDRAAVRQEVSLDGRGRRRDAPRRAHLTPRLGEAPPYALGAVDLVG